MGDVEVAKKKKKKSASASSSSKNKSEVEASYVEWRVLQQLTPFDLLQVARCERRACERVFGARGDEALWRVMCEAEFAHVATLAALDEAQRVDVVGASLAELRARRPALQSWQATYRFLASRLFLEQERELCGFWTSAFLRPDVEAELMVRVPGTYCVRPSSTGSLDCVLSANADGRVQHHLIVCLGGQRGVMLLDKHYRTIAGMLVGQEAVKLHCSLAHAPKLQDAMARVSERVKAAVAALKSAAKRAKKRGDAAPLVPDDRDALHLAARWGLEEEALAMLELGIDVNLRAERDGDTALHCALSTVLRSDTTKLIEALLDKGADINARDKSNMTPLLTAVCQPSPHMEAVQLIVRAKPDLAVLRKGLPAPLIAVARGIRPVVDMFLGGKAAPILEARGAAGEGALHVAARFGRRDLIELLIAAGAPIEATDSDGATPLHYAVKDARDSWINVHMFGPAQRPFPPFAVCQFLVQDHKANINARDKRGRTPLMYAAYNGQRSAVRALYELGARGTAAARADGVRGRQSPQLLHQIDTMAYYVFCGMKVQMAGFLGTIDEQFKAIALTLANDRPDSDGETEQATEHKKKSKKAKKPKQHESSDDEDDAPAPAALASPRKGAYDTSPRDNDEPTDPTMDTMRRAGGDKKKKKKPKKRVESAGGGGGDDE